MVRWFRNLVTTRKFRAKYKLEFMICMVTNLEYTVPTYYYDVILEKKIVFTCFCIIY